jgi:putative nucleotidyltransferase with HDIG domain
LPEVDAHHLRVGELAAARAEAMGLDEGTVALVRKAGCLHDCGKIDAGIIPWVRSKLTFRAQNTPLVNHPIIGANMVREQFGLDVARLVAGHHPAYFGSTYAAASGAQKAIIEADIWDALRESRVYKNPSNPISSVSEAADILMKNGVSQEAADWWVSYGDDLASELKFHFFANP